MSEVAETRKGCGSQRKSSNERFWKSLQVYDLMDVMIMAQVSRHEKKDGKRKKENSLQVL